MTCPEKPIRAHSVQNATALSCIEDKNHVYQMKMKMKDESPVVGLELVGRNQASTFTGLCSAHDNELFKPIDDSVLDERDREQLFLIAYRSVTKELHATLDGAMKMQSAYLKLIEDGAVLKDKPSAEGIEALQHMFKAWAAWRYRYRFFDKPLERRRFNGIKHLKFVLEGKPPAVAASSFFSMDFKEWGKPFAALIVNVIPTDSESTLVMFSYSEKHAMKATKRVSKIIKNAGAKREYEMSCLLLDRAENFFLAPRNVDGWSPRKRAEIEAAFAQDLLGPNPFCSAPMTRTPLLNLFAAD